MKLLPRRRPLPARSIVSMGRADAGPLVSVLVLSALSLTAHAAPGDSSAAKGSGVTSFDTTFLRTRPNETVDVSRFEHSNSVAPGSYNVDILVNGLRKDRMDLRFEAPAEGEGARPCFTRKMLEEFGVDFAKVDAQGGASSTSADATECKDIGSWIPQASVDFDFTEQKLNLVIAQSYMRSSARGYVSPDRWQYGVNVGFLNYNANVYHTSVDGRDSTQSYLGLNAGLNLGGWRFRTQGSLTSGSEEGAHYENIATYVQHDVQSLGAQATIGDAYTSGEIFDSVAFRGVQLATDDRMLPDSQRGYAPVVRGTAQSNARVTIRQNSQVIYETNVPPGPFEINDLYPTGYGGNLEVTVTEASGRASSFTVPYAAVPQSLRPGITRYSATAGQLRSDVLQEKPNFAQFTMQRGLSNAVTAYGGAVVASGYAAVNVGAALNTKYGAFAADVTGSSTEVPGQGTWRGTSWRASYNKYFAPTDTNIALAAYRYSSPNYLSLSDAASVRDLALYNGDTNDVARQRGRLQLTLNQNLGSKWGTVFLSASTQNYWNRDKPDTFFQAGYTNSFKYGTYSITAGRTRDMDGRMSNQVAIGLTIPLGRKAHAPLLTTNVTHAGGATDVQSSISGSLGEQNQFSYNAYGSANHDELGNSGSAGASGTYRGAYGQLSASASAGQGSNQMSIGASGAVVVHPGGVTFSQTVGDTFGIVHAPGAEGASVSSAPGVKVDDDGYAVVPYLSPYTLNTVDIDPKGTSTDVEFASTSEQAVPRDGAVPMLEYETVTGRAALIEAPRSNGKALPFGADVLDGEGRTVGVVAQGSRLFVRGVEDQGSLIVTWGDAKNEQCRVDYQLPPAGEQTSYTSIQGQCRPAALAAGMASGPSRNPTTYAR